MLEEGWYLLSVAELEALLSSIREGATLDLPAGVRLSTEEALAFRDRGNIPDEGGRSLRLVLHMDHADPEGLARRRAVFEPDYHAAPSWRRPGSKLVNVVPIPGAGRSQRGAEAWWDDPDVAALEAEWQRVGTMRGVKVPAELRSFVHKTVLALEAAGRHVDATSIADSVARWLPPEDADEIRAALLQANDPR